ncbi:SMI1/KNR4 family protein [Rhizobium lentis]|uniref:hypothetical protein n=1 Tax=Rhizobium lentis TaxID=1138194 RepID=UPI001C83147A|nr:hypothetical protein [Rhizobium lentis]MBX5154979.1 SMI1/KNR4 family protein [Rhizobium lentis]MBX5174780.1 SMI1/KNR4 family protein [Rhizobium lentis]
MIDKISQLLDVDQSKELSSLEPVSNEKLSGIIARYPAISQQYLEFIRVIGVGSTTKGFYIYEPEPASFVERHPSFQLYQSSSYSKVYGARPEGDSIPADAVSIADCGASWRYCLWPSSGGGVFCLDMAGPSFEPEADDFYSFVLTNVILDKALQ